MVYLCVIIGAKFLPKSTLKCEKYEKTKRERDVQASIVYMEYAEQEAKWISKIITRVQLPFENCLCVCVWMKTLLHPFFKLPNGYFERYATYSTHSKPPAGHPYHVYVNRKCWIWY